ncbi:MAG: carboxypeptidase regulatory-like domain-containing protein [candidate division Zixibacteria bacterium]|nr:carboxypeptidase regulatory-like domain-containing protein [candidate division Zixibacteria bacterium]
MPKNKFGFCLIFVLVVGLCANLLASDKDMPLQHKLKWLKNSPLFQKEAMRPLFPDPWLSQETQRFTKAVNGTGAISGYVTQASGGAPIEGVEVTAEQLTCPSYSASDTTDPSGFYIIGGLPPGDYEVYTDNGYFPLDSVFVDVYWDDKLPWEDADTVVVSSNDTTEDICFFLRVGGKITGTVTLSGAPPFMTIVYAIDTTSRESYYGFADNLTGSYVIKRLPTGVYKVKTVSLPFFSLQGYVDEYYDDKSGWATADPVPVTEGGISSAIDFTLSLGGSIEGNISSAVKEPLDLDSITVVGYFASNPEWFSFGFTDDYGDYSLMGLRTGYWKILVYGDTSYAFEWYNDKDTWADADSVEVTAPDAVPDIDCSLEVGGSISGHVYDLGGFPLSGCDVEAYQGSPYQWGMVAKWGTTSADGSYKIGGLRTGDYYVMAFTECHGIWYDDQTNPEEADSVHVTMPSDHSGIDFYLTTAVETEDEIAQRPAEFELHQNYPNPFNPGTRIEYTLRKRGHVTLHIYNVLGEKVKTLLDQAQPAGFYQINWDGKNDSGKPVSSGLYFYKLEVDGFSQAKRMLLLK